jgi:hypothetical protein
MLSSAQLHCSLPRVVEHLHHPHHPSFLNND